MGDRTAESRTTSFGLFCKTLRATLLKAAMLDKDTWSQYRRHHPERVVACALWLRSTCMHCRIAATVRAVAGLAYGTCVWGDAGATPPL
jgi:hypothetical protein